MFSYYGSKSKVINLYPPPKYGKIIEPFAGSARYALKYFDRDILLVDKYPAIVNLWKWLQTQSEKDILNLPDVKLGDDIRDLKLSDGARLLMGFCINNGSVTPKNIVCQFQNWNKDKRRIASQLFKIKNWDIRLGAYDEIENQEATWFIDPPYQFGGEFYKMSGNDLNFNKLREWCESRKGQSIVCENTKADWMPFKAMRKQRGAVYSTTEAIWSNMPHGYELQQKELFT